VRRFRRLLGRETVQAAESALASPLETVSKKEMVNLASKKRTIHILDGEQIGSSSNRWGGGHLHPGRPGKSIFPESWDGDRIMHHISDVATDPKISWIPDGRLIPGGFPRFRAEGIRYDLGHEVKIRTIIEPMGEGIISGYPISK
jgi:hypothetical protein